MNNTFYNNHTFYLAHYGIAGQKWGVRNGPPYPLNAQTHNKVTDKALNKIVKLRKEIKDNRKGPVDKESGYHLKNDKTHDINKDMLAVNPGHKWSVDDTSFNCVCCSTAYELRSRGYDVMATLSKKPFHHSDLYKKIFNGFVDKFEKKETYANPKYFGRGIRAQDHKLLYDKLLEDTDKNGYARGILELQYLNHAHLVNYEVFDNKIHIIDSQDAGYATVKNKTNFLYRLSDTDYVIYNRLDNLTINPKKIKDTNLVE